MPTQTSTPARTQEVRILSPPKPGEPPAIELAATLYLPSEAPVGERAPGLIVGHGAGSRRSRHAEFCREACATGFVVLALDFRGHGESAGLADGPLESDLVAAAAFFRAHPGVVPEKICYRGSSMGGFYGLKAAPEAAFAAMALLCPATESVILHAIDQHEAGGDERIEGDTEAIAIDAKTGSGGQVDGAADTPTRWDSQALASISNSSRAWS